MTSLIMPEYTPEPNPKVELKDVRVEYNYQNNLIYICDYDLDYEDVVLLSAFLNQHIDQMKASHLEELRTAWHSHFD